MQAIGICWLDIDREEEEGGWRWRGVGGSGEEGWGVSGSTVEHTPYVQAICITHHELIWCNVTISVLEERDRETGLGAGTSPDWAPNHGNGTIVRWFLAHFGCNGHCRRQNQKGQEDCWNFVNIFSVHVARRLLVNSSSRSAVFFFYSRAT